MAVTRVSGYSLLEAARQTEALRRAHIIADLLLFLDDGGLAAGLHAQVTQLATGQATADDSNVAADGPGHLGRHVAGEGGRVVVLQEHGADAPHEVVERTLLALRLVAVQHFQEVVGRDDVLAVGTGHIESDGSAAHSHDGRIGLHRLHQRRRHLGVQMHGDLGMLAHLVDHIVQIALMIGAEDRAHLHTAAQARAHLVQVDGVAALGRGQRRIDAGRAGTHHHNALLLLRWRIHLVQQLGPEMRVHTAVNQRQAAGHHVVDAAAAHDALAHIGRAVLHDLQRQRRVGDGVAQTRDDVALPVLQILLHHRGIGVAVALAHRLFRHRLDLLGDVHPVAVLDALGGQGHARLVPAHGQIVQIQAGLFHPLGNLQRLLHGEAGAVIGLNEVDGRPTHHDGIVGTYHLAHAANNLESQAGTVLEAAAVLVGAIVGGLAHETAENAAHAGHDLHGIEAGVLAHLHRVEELGLERLDLLEGHGLEAAHHGDDGNLGGTVGALLGFRVGLPVVHVVDLRADKAVVLVHRIDHVLL